MPRLDVGVPERLAVLLAVGVRDSDTEAGDLPNVDDAARGVADAVDVAFVDRLHSAPTAAIRDRESNRLSPVARRTAPPRRLPPRARRADNAGTMATKPAPDLDALLKYRQKRDFKKTPEPEPAAPDEPAT